MSIRDWKFFDRGWAIGLVCGMAWVTTAVACGPAAKTALDVIAPIAADALTDLIQDRFGSATDEDSAGCFPLPGEFNDSDEGYVYILCRAKPQE